MSDKFEEKYGNTHREIKQERIKMVGKNCEISGEAPNKEKKIHAHHLQKISLAFLHKSHVKENIRNILDTIHMDFHKNTESDIEDGKLIYKRQQYAKQVYVDPTNTEARNKLDNADSLLIPEYVDKIMSLPEDYKEMYERHALIGAYETNKALMIELRKKELELEELKKEIEEIKNSTKAKIINILDYKHHLRQE